MSLPDQLAVYFGTFGHGHFLHGGLREHTLRPQRDVPGFPWDMAAIDSGLLHTHKIPDRPDGRVWRTTAADMLREPLVWHAFVWWDRTVDRRPGSNSGFYVRGFSLDEPVTAYSFACTAWPHVAARRILQLQSTPLG